MSVMHRRVSDGKRIDVRPAAPTAAAKTTCKDRWRQILNEADRLRDENKYLCTMQQGISAAQMDEMQAEKVVLVVPKAYHSAFPKEKRDRIWTLGKFVRYVKEMEGLICGRRIPTDRFAEQIGRDAEQSGHKNFNRIANPS